MDEVALLKSLSVTAVGYPFYLARTLMQLGYEPIPPDEFNNVPNVLSYLDIIKNERGYLSLYTGFCYVFPAVALKKCTYDFMATAIDHKKEVTSRTQPAEIVDICIRESFIKVNTTIITYPITTITMGYIASKFFGSEDSVEYSLSFLYNGIGPKLTFEVIMVWVETISRWLAVKSSDDETNQAILSRLPPFVLQTLLYPLNVVSTVMCDNGRSGFNPRFHRWDQCWKYLADSKQLRRGTNFIFRKVYPQPGVNLYQSKLLQNYKSL